MCRRRFGWYIIGNSVGRLSSWYFSIRASASGSNFTLARSSVLLAAIFQPEAPIVVRVEVLTGDAHHIRIGGSRIAGKQEKVADEYVCGAPCGYLHITDFSRSPRGSTPSVSALSFAGKVKFAKKYLSAYPPCRRCGIPFSRWRDIVAHGVHRQAFHVHDIILVIVYELFGKLPKAMSFVLNCHSMNSPQCPSHVVIAGVRSFGTVDADTRLQVLADAVGHPKQRHLRFNAALEQVLDRRRVKVPLALHQACRTPH